LACVHWPKEDFCLDLRKRRDPNKKFKLSNYMVVNIYRIREIRKCIGGTSLYHLVTSIYSA
jgi:hypothetical protein